MTARRKSPSERTDHGQSLEVVVNGRTRLGADLDGILRRYIQSRIDKAGWSEVATSAALGVKKSTLISWLKGGEAGTTIGLVQVARMCAALSMTPVELFQAALDHSSVGPPSKIAAPWSIDGALQAILNGDQARRLVDLVVGLDELGVLEEQLAVWSAQLGAPLTRRRTRRR